IVAIVASSNGSRTPCASAVAPAEIAVFASGRLGACTDARIPDARASPRRASTTAGGTFGKGVLGARHHAMSSSISLISAPPSAFASRTDRRASSAVAGKRFRWLSGGSPWSHQPPFVVKMGAAGNTSGTSERFRDAAAWACEIATSSAISRTVVTPQRSIVRRSSSDSACTWASTNPGMIHSPAASTISVPTGRSRIASGVATPTETTRPSDTSSRAFRSGGAPVPSTSVAPRMAIVVASRMDPLTPGRPDLLGLERVLFHALLFLDLDRIDAREARRAGRLLRPAEDLEHAFDREIPEAVRLDEFPDLVDGLVGGDQLVTRRRVDAVVAALDGRRRGDPDVDLLRSGLAQHADD